MIAKPLKTLDKPAFLGFRMIVVGGAVAHFCATIRAIDPAGKQAAFACLCPAMPLLANLLHLVKDLLLDDRRVGVVENRMFFNRRFPLFLIPDGIGVGLEIDGAARVFPPFQNVNDRVGVPMVRISGFRAGCLDVLALLVGGGIKYLFLLQELCNLHRGSPFHAQLENALDYFRDSRCCCTQPCPWRSDRRRNSDLEAGSCPLVSGTGGTVCGS